jgi:hypothetical protein
MASSRETGARLRGWPLTALLTSAIAFTFVIQAVGGAFEKAALGGIVGVLSVGMVVALRLVQNRRVG